MLENYEYLFETNKSPMRILPENYYYLPKWTIKPLLFKKTKTRKTFLSYFFIKSEA